MISNNNIKKPWSLDFSYSYFKNLLNIAKNNFNITLLTKIPDLLIQPEVNKPRIILRHDVDVSIKRAAEMARIEYSLGIKSTYMVMINCPLYTLKNPNNKKMLREIILLGHEIGLHFNIDDKDRLLHINIADIEKQISKDCNFLEEVICSPVHTLSFHRPMQQFINGQLFVSNKINAYAKELMNWYLSDSKGYWRDGEPIPDLINPKDKILQLLIHPIWWGEEHLSARDRLDEFVGNETKGKEIRYREKYYQTLMRVIPGAKLK